MATPTQRGGHPARQGKRTPTRHTSRPGPAQRGSTPPTNEGNPRQPCKGDLHSRRVDRGPSEMGTPQPRGEGGTRLPGGRDPRPTRKTTRQQQPSPDDPSHQTAVDQGVGRRESRQQPGQGGLRHPGRGDLHQPGEVALQRRPDQVDHHRPDGGGQHQPDQGDLRHPCEVGHHDPSQHRPQLADRTQGHRSKPPTRQQRAKPKPNRSARETGEEQVTAGDLPRLRRSSRVGTEQHRRGERSPGQEEDHQNQQSKACGPAGGAEGDSAHSSAEPSPVLGREPGDTGAPSVQVGDEEEVRLRRSARVPRRPTYLRDYVTFINER
ncbi:proline-rich protein HaeIII subfamily 1-like [Pituophis catenifer annectens]|uniref:proline-rich protein HaeIII subfamily 1-like n=1 Tax=Pituophis catenifer annectens TaxID=94852 RepID=UPI00399287EF